MEQSQLLPFIKNSVKTTWQTPRFSFRAGTTSVIQFWQNLNITEKQQEGEKDERPPKSSTEEAFTQASPTPPTQLARQSARVALSIMREGGAGRVFNPERPPILPKSELLPLFSVFCSNGGFTVCLFLRSLKRETHSTRSCSPCKNLPSSYPPSLSSLLSSTLILPLILLYTDLDLLKVICPHPSGIQAVAATTDFKWVFTAGADGVIRRFDFFASMNGKLPLTQLQKHGIPDIITKVRPPPFLPTARRTL